MSDDDFQAKAAFYDSSYASSLAIMIENLFKIARLMDNHKLHALANQSLEKQLAAFKNRPSQYPRGLSAYLQSLLSVVVLKSIKVNLLKNKATINIVTYPYLLLKPSEDANFLACKIDTCFAIDKNLHKVIKKVEGL